jgi:hypothetical protein
MSVLFNLKFFFILCVVKDVDRNITAVVIALEFNGLKQFRVPGIATVISNQPASSFL